MDLGAALLGLVEFRLLPSVALLLALMAIWQLRARRQTPALRLLALSLGFQAYSYFELVLYRATDEALIGSLGHEVGELWFLLAVAEFLRRTFGARGSATAVSKVEEPLAEASPARSVVPGGAPRYPVAHVERNTFGFGISPRRHGECL